MNENSIAEHSVLSSDAGLDDKSLDISFHAANMDPKDKEEALESRLVPQIIKSIYMKLSHYEEQRQKIFDTMFT